MPKKMFLRLVFFLSLGQIEINEITTNGWELKPVKCRTEIRKKLSEN